MRRFDINRNRVSIIVQETNRYSRLDAKARAIAGREYFETPSRERHVYAKHQRREVYRSPFDFWILQLGWAH